MNPADSSCARHTGSYLVDDLRLLGGEVEERHLGDRGPLGCQVGEGHGGGQAVTSSWRAGTPTQV